MKNLDRLASILENAIPGLPSVIVDLPHLVCILLDRDLCVLATNGGPDDPVRPVPPSGRWLSDLYQTKHIHPILSDLAGKPLTVSLPGRDGTPRLVGHFFAVSDELLFIGESDNPLSNPVIADISRLNDELMEMNQQYKESRDALTLANRQITQLSITDTLTKLKNRRALIPRLKEETARVTRYGIACSVILMDLDHFKAINDRFGHHVGDKVLTAVGQLIRNEMRVEDTPCRWGGEEFLILLPHTAVTQAKACARRIQKSMRTLRIDEIDSQITASFGISQLSAEENGDAAIHRADQALYAAKHAGRDRIWIHLPEDDSEKP